MEKVSFRGKEIGEQVQSLRQETAKNVDLGARELQDRLSDMIVRNLDWTPIG